MELHRSESFCTGVINRVKGPPLWEKVEGNFATNISDKELLLQICKELAINCTKQEQKIPINMGR